MSGGSDTTIVKHLSSAIEPAMVKVTEQPYFFSRANLKFGGTTFAKFRNFSISVNNQLDPRYYVTQSTSTDNRQILSEILEGRRAITISGSLDMDASVPPAPPANPSITSRTRSMVAKAFLHTSFSSIASNSALLYPIKRRSISTLSILASQSLPDPTLFLRQQVSQGLRG